MSATILQYFIVKMKNPTNNVHAEMKVLAEADVDAIELAKTKLGNDLLEFINKFGRHPNSFQNHKLPANFWDNTTITCEVQQKAQVLKMDYDRMNQSYGFVLG
jgi:hypothetical protein